MTDILVLCDGARDKGRVQTPKTTLELATVGPKTNVRYQVDVFTLRLMKELEERLDDLLRIAAFVYAADTRISRGGIRRDVYANEWRRVFRMVVPVWDLDFWRSQTVQDALVQTLEFLTGDEFSFKFQKRSEGKPLQQIFEFQETLEPLSDSDLVVLFSGGADSLAAVVESVNEGHSPVLVSHRAAPVVDKRQRVLVQQIRNRFKSWAFPHVSMWVNRAGGKRPREFTQRSRSFLFTSLGVVTSALLNIDNIRLCDNGVVSINLPSSSQNVGTFLTRSTHPRYINLAEKLTRQVTENEQLSIRNTLLFRTKKEVLQILSTSGCPDLLQESVSCAHVEGMTRLQPHCGVCPQCIDRRFASIAAGLEEHDLASRYKKNIFVDALKDGEERTHAENYLRFAKRLEDIDTPDSFFVNFLELIDCLPVGEDLDFFGRNLHDLFQRHHTAVNGVLEKQLSLHLSKIRRGTLSPTCMLRIVGAGELTTDQRYNYVNRLCELVCQSLPAAFQTEQARNERHVQDVGQAIFQAAQEELQRESPQIPFAAVTTKPDFSGDPEIGPTLFIEFKYVKERRRLNAVQTEMTSRVMVYRKQGACVLFIVYDPNRAITNDKEFTRAFESNEGVWVGIAR